MIVLEQTFNHTLLKSLPVVSFSYIFQGFNTEVDNYDCFMQMLVIINATIHNNANTVRNFLQNDLNVSAASIMQTVPLARHRWV